MVDLKSIRNAKNVTQCQVAKEVGISLSHYSLIENNKRSPSVEVAKRIGQVLDFKWTLLFDRKTA